MFLYVKTFVKPSWSFRKFGINIIYDQNTVSRAKLLKYLFSFFVKPATLSQKARHRDSDAAAATAAALANFLKSLYFRRWNTWMFHTLYMDASCYDVSISHMSNILDLIFMVQWLLEKKVKIFCNDEFSLIISHRITIFGMRVPCKVLMSVRQFSLDLDLI